TVIDPHPPARYPLPRSRQTPGQHHNVYIDRAHNENTWCSHKYTISSSTPSAAQATCADLDMPPCPLSCWERVRVRALAYARALSPSPPALSRGERGLSTMH